MTYLYEDCGCAGCAILGKPVKLNVVDGGKISPYRLIEGVARSTGNGSGTTSENFNVAPGWTVDMIALGDKENANTDRNRVLLPRSMNYSSYLASGVVRFGNVSASGQEPWPKIGDEAFLIFDWTETGYCEAGIRRTSGGYECFLRSSTGNEMVAEAYAASSYLSNVTVTCLRRGDYVYAAFSETAKTTVERAGISLSPQTEHPGGGYMYNDLGFFSSTGGGFLWKTKVGFGTNGINGNVWVPSGGPYPSPYIVPEITCERKTESCCRVSFPKPSDGSGQVGVGAKGYGSGCVISATRQNYEESSEFDTAWRCGPRSNDEPIHPHGFFGHEDVAISGIKTNQSRSRYAATAASKSEVSVNGFYRWPVYRDYPVEGEYLYDIVVPNRTPPPVQADMTSGVEITFAPGLSYSGNLTTFIRRMYFTGTMSGSEINDQISGGVDSSNAVYMTGELLSPWVCAVNVLGDGTRYCVPEGATVGTITIGLTTYRTITFPAGYMALEGFTYPWFSTGVQSATVPLDNNRLWSSVAIPGLSFGNPSFPIGVEVPQG